MTTKVLRCIVAFIALSYLIGTVSVSASPLCTDRCCRARGNQGYSHSIEGEECSHQNANFCWNKRVFCQGAVSCVCGTLTPATASESKRENLPSKDLGVKSNQNFLPSDSSEAAAKHQHSFAPLLQPIYLLNLVFLI